MRCAPAPHLQYDQSVSTFSPDGKIFQVEYAQKAVESAGTSIGVRCADGVILGVEKLLISKLLVPGSGSRLHMLDDHIGVVRPWPACVRACCGAASTCCCRLWAAATAGVRTAVPHSRCVCVSVSRP